MNHFQQMVLAEKKSDYHVYLEAHMNFKRYIIFTLALISILIVTSIFAWNNIKNDLSVRFFIKNYHEMNDVVSNTIENNIDLNILPNNNASIIELPFWKKHLSYDGFIECTNEYIVFYPYFKDILDSSNWQGFMYYYDPDESAPYDKHIISNWYVREAIGRNWDNIETKLLSQPPAIPSAK